MQLTFGDVYLENHAGIAAFDALSGSETFGADIAAHGDVVMENHSFVLGDVVAGGDVFMSNNSEIGGDLYLAGELVQQHSSSVDGIVHALDLPPEPCECGYDLDAVMAWRSENNDNFKLQQDPCLKRFFDGGSLVVDCSGGGCCCSSRAHGAPGRCPVILPAGAYYLDGFEVRGNAVVELAEGAEVELYVKDRLVVERNARLQPDPARADDLLIVFGADTDAGGQLVLRNNSDLAMMLYAPSARLALPNHVYLYGAIVVRELHGGNHGRLFTDTTVCSDPPALTCNR